MMEFKEMNKIKVPEDFKLSSRTRYQKQVLSNMKASTTLKALNLMIDEMCIEKGFKRSSGVHYYHHIVDVVQLLLNYGITDEKTLTAAALHDAIEDTWITKEYIENEYDHETAQLVLTLTKDPNVDYKVEIDKLQKYIINCFSDIRTALIKTADRVHNFGTLGATPLEKQLRVALETEAHFFPLFDWASEEYPEFAGFFHMAKTTIEPHLEKIKEQVRMKNEYEGIIAEKDAEILKLKSNSVIN